MTFVIVVDLILHSMTRSHAQLPQQAIHNDVMEVCILSVVQQICSVNTWIRAKRRQGEAQKICFLLCILLLGDTTFHIHDSATAHWMLEGFLGQAVKSFASVFVFISGDGFGWWRALFLEYLGIPSEKCVLL